MVAAAARERRQKEISAAEVWKGTVCFKSLLSPVPGHADNIWQRRYAGRCIALKWKCQPAGQASRGCAATCSHLHVSAGLLLLSPSRTSMHSPSFSLSPLFHATSSHVQLLRCLSFSPALPFILRVLSSKQKRARACRFDELLRADPGLQKQCKETVGSPPFCFPPSLPNRERERKVAFTLLVPDCLPPSSSPPCLSLSLFLF